MGRVSFPAGGRENINDAAYREGLATVFGLIAAQSVNREHHNRVFFRALVGAANHKSKFHAIRDFLPDSSVQIARAKQLFI